MTLVLYWVNVENILKIKKKPVQYLLLIIIVLKKIRNLEKLCSLVFKNCIFISMSMLLYYYS